MTDVEIIRELLRTEGDLTQQQIAERLGWNLARVSDALCKRAHDAGIEHVPARER